MYIKPSANFKMNNATKLLLSGISSKAERDGWKKMMIQAQLQGSVVHKSSREDRKPKVLAGYVAVDGTQATE
jgi:hypothetical protein